MKRNITLLFAALTTLAIAIAAILVACGDFGPVTSCTEIGCDHQLTINFVDEDGAPLDEFSGEMTYDGEAIEFECEPGDDAYGTEYHCRQGALIVSASPEEVVIDVSSGDLSASTTLTPEYDEVQPNGPDCPPTCEQGEETVALQ